MFNDPLHWFPSPIFSTLLGLLFFGVFLIDYIVPKITTPQGNNQPVVRRDRSSFLLIQGAGLLAVFATIACRYFNWTITPGWVQWVALVIGVAGLLFREWAVIKLGRNFSRVVEIEAEHHLVKDGPYRWIRHPAYTGMLLIYFGITLAVGSWIGALAAAFLVGAATLYRIRVEEVVLLEAFGQEYQDYKQLTWRLFPGW
jgi:protein-S-isoprenylcysteine O-methyltransferase Ste14